MKFMTVLLCLLASQPILAQEVPVQEIAPADWFVEFGNVLAQLPGLKWQMQVVLLITVAISALKVSAWRPVWDKLGPYKTFVAPVLALGASVLTAFAKGEVNVGTLLIALTTGAGAIAFHEIMDAVKNVPGISPGMAKVTDLLSAILRGNKK